LLVLDIPRECPPGFSHVEVPLYHRVHLGLAANQDLHVCLLAGSSDPHLPELVISPFEFDEWDKLYRLNMTLTDRVGLFHEVCAILGHYNAKVLAAESSAAQHQNLYQLEMVISLKELLNVEWIRLRLLASFLKEMDLLENGNPRLRIQRLTSLWLAKRAYDDQKRNQKGFPPLCGAAQVKWIEQTQSQVLQLVLPQGIRDILAKTVRLDSKQPHADGFYLRQSDTKNRFLRVLYFRSDDPVVYARIEYIDRIGAAADITGALKASGFTILTGYLGPSNDSRRCRLELVTRCKSLAGLRSAQRKAAFEKALADCPETVDLQIAVGYPGSYAREWEKKDIVSTCREQSHKITKGLSFDDLRKLLTQQHKRLSAEGMTHSSGMRLKLVRRLSAQHDALLRPHGTGIKILFVSGHFKGVALEEVVRRATAKGFTVVTGKNLLEYSSFRRGLLEKMGSCTHFLGLWSDEGAQIVGEKHWPSPWLLWEFGVAEASGLAWRLLISERIDEAAWKRLAPEQQHAIFGETDFQARLTEILDVLAREPIKPSPTRDTLDGQDGYDVGGFGQTGS
jgi:hypothetical protein